MLRSISGIVAIGVVLVLPGCAASDIQPRSADVDHRYEDQEARLLEATRDMSDRFEFYRPRHDQTSVVEKDLQRILDRVKPANTGDEPVRVVVVYENMPNAFALATGEVYITTKMLSLIETEEEAAFVLAHEYAHYELRHMLKTAIYQERAAQASAWLGLLIASSVSAVTGVYSDLSATPAYAVGAMAASGYSRELELEADRYALDLLVQSGYDPSGARAIFEKLAELGEPDEFGLLSSHPGWNERLDEFETLLASYPSSVPPAKALPEQLQSAMLALAAMTEEEALYLTTGGASGSPDPLSGIGHRRSFEEFLAFIKLAGCPASVQYSQPYMKIEEFERIREHNQVVLFEAGTRLEAEERYVEAAACYHSLYAYWGGENQAEVEFRVGRMLEQGNGFSVSVERARMFYRRAMMGGHMGATERLMQLSLDDSAE